MDVDVLIELPADEHSLYGYYNDGQTRGATGNLGTKRDWRYDRRPDLLHSTVLYQTGTTTEAGDWRRRGGLLLGPRAAKLVLVPRIGGLVSNVTDAAYTVALELTPRYAYLIGNVS